jgi:hypothetical protein
MNKPFDAYEYFENLCNTNKITSSGRYKFCRVTGLSNMEEVIANFKKENAYFCVDDTEDGAIIQSPGGGYFERRQYTVFLLKKFPLNNMTAQHEALNECREIYRQITKKLIDDRRFLENSMTYLKVERIPYYEVPGYFISGCTGLYFMITIDIPVDLCYNTDDWF